MQRYGSKAPVPDTRWFRFFFCQDQKMKPASPVTEKRLQKRRKMVLPVKIMLTGSNLLVHTLDISTSGVRIGSIRENPQPGQMVGLSRGARKAQFRIIWIEQRGHEFHAGLKGIQAGENFWGIDLNGEEGEGDQKASPEVLKLATPH
jgi:hypothetical protein